MKKLHFYWVDNVKILATALVAIGHLYMGLTQAGIMARGVAYNCVISALYTFHVPLFFICSGFLYQRLTKYQDFKSYSKGILKKLISLGIPYLVFSSITYLLKFIFSSDVNTENEAGYLKTIFVSPSAPYWFLYALFLIFLVTPIITSKKGAIISGVLSVGLYFACAVGLCKYLPSYLELITTYICNNLIWFVIGMLLAYFDFQYKARREHAIFIFPFIAFFVITKNSVSFIGKDLLLGLLACSAIVLPFWSYDWYFHKGKTRATKFLAKYTMPVFLMHTIFSAGARSVLLRLGVTNAPVHIIVGLIASFCLPILAGMIMEKIKLDFLYSPTKYIKIK